MYINLLLVDGIFVRVHGCVAGYKAFEDVIVEFRHILRLLAFFVARSSGLLWLRFQAAFIYIFDRQWKSTLLF